jgi:hypothetical protein
MARRSFLRGAPAAIAGAAMAARQTAAALAGVSTGAGASPLGPATLPSNAYALPDPSYIDGAARVRAKLKQFLQLALPDWKLKEIAEAAKRDSRTLDPDIASMRSLSLVGQTTMQRRRLEARYREQIGDAMEAEAGRKEYRGKYNIWI